MHPNDFSISCLFDVLTIRDLHVVIFWWPCVDCALFNHKVTTEVRGSCVMMLHLQRLHMQRTYLACYRRMAVRLKDFHTV